MTTQMIVRIDPDLKAKVNNFAKIEGKNVSEVVNVMRQKLCAHELEYLQ